MIGWCILLSSTLSLLTSLKARPASMRRVLAPRTTECLLVRTPYSSWRRLLLLPSSPCQCLGELKIPFPLRPCSVLIHRQLPPNTAYLKDLVDVSHPPNEQGR